MSDVKINYSTSDFRIYFDKYNNAGGFAFFRTTFGKYYRKNPGRVKTPVTANFLTFARCVPTIYEILEITPPGILNGGEQDPLDGVSMVYTFDQPDAKTTKRAQYFEILGSRGVYHDGWMACVFGPRAPWSTDMHGIFNWNPEKDVWELYKLNEDYSQSKNLAKKYQEKLNELKAIFDREATHNHVYPIGRSFYTVFCNPMELPSLPRIEWSFFEGKDRIPEAMAPTYQSGRSSLAISDAEIEKDTEGVLFALGGISGFFTASETFDNGKDLGSPVALDYYDRASFKFSGKINQINFKYIQ